MKVSNLLTTLVLAGFLTACGSADKAPNAEQPAHHDDAHGAAISGAYTIDPAATAIAWTGNATGVKAYSHTGGVKVKSGTVTVAENKITGGEFVVDMTTIFGTDSASFSEDHPISDLEGHLTTGDFFLVDSFPEAKFVLTSVANDVITGDLTIRDNTNPETISISNLNVTETEISAQGKLVFDRQKYDVKWKHYMKDMFLADNITLDIKVIAKK